MARGPNMARLNKKKKDSQKKESQKKQMVPNGDGKTEKKNAKEVLIKFEVGGIYPVCHPGKFDGNFNCCFKIKKITKKQIVFSNGRRKKIKKYKRTNGPWVERAFFEPYAALAADTKVGFGWYFQHLESASNWI